MEIKETVAGLIRQAEHFNAGVTELSMDYDENWEVRLIVKRKIKGTMKENTKK